MAQAAPDETKQHVISNAGQSVGVTAPCQKKSKGKWLDEDVGWFIPPQMPQAGKPSGVHSMRFSEWRNHTNHGFSTLQPVFAGRLGFLRIPTEYGQFLASQLVRRLAANRLQPISQTLDWMMVYCEEDTRNPDSEDFAEKYGQHNPDEEEDGSDKEDEQVHEQTKNKSKSPRVQRINVDTLAKQYPPDEKQFQYLPNRGDDDSQWKALQKQDEWMKKRQQQQQQQQKKHDQQNSDVKDNEDDDVTQTEVETHIELDYVQPRNALASTLLGCNIYGAILLVPMYWDSPDHTPPIRVWDVETCIRDPAAAVVQKVEIMPLAFEAWLTSDLHQLISLWPKHKQAAQKHGLVLPLEMAISTSDLKQFPVLPVSRFQVGWIIPPRMVSAPRPVTDVDLLSACHSTEWLKTALGSDKIEYATPTFEAVCSVLRVFAERGWWTPTQDVNPNMSQMPLSMHWTVICVELSDGIANRVATYLTGHLIRGTVLLCPQSWIV